MSLDSELSLGTRDSGLVTDMDSGFSLGTRDLCFTWLTQVWMVSGDNERTARHIASRVGIKPECVAAGVLPEGKLEQACCERQAAVGRELAE